MSRFVKEEYKGLQEFLNSYESNKNLNEKVVEDALKRIHKMALSLLAWKIEFEKYKMKINLLYFNEVISDLVQTIPLFVQGFYKAAFCLLRSAIENFYKFYLINVGEIDLTGVKYTDRIYENIKELPLVKSNNFLSDNFSAIKSLYSTLCQYVHSAESFCTFEEALSSFPKYEEEDIKNFNNHFEIYSKAVNNILCFSFNTMYYRMNHINFELVTSNLSKATITIVRELERRLEV
ncbi:hypothetical protein CN279_04945 [Bacillus anthracis]|nr:hypothetical protein CN279_04945 [Bacillus anthracis]